jgi:hypothetical protein
MLRIGKGIDRHAVRRALSRPGGAETIVYDDILGVEDILETVAGVMEAGLPEDALPLLAWLASHPNTPEDVLRSLLEIPSRTVLVSLAMNQSLPADMRNVLMGHSDDDVREHANHAFSKARRH